MKRVLAVHLGKEETPLGALYFDQKGARESAAFEYGASWLASPDRFPVEPGLPLVRGPQFHKQRAGGSVFANAIADTEPDGWARRVINRDHAKRRQDARRQGKTTEARPLNALDYLLAVDDFSRIGALRFVDEDGRYQRSVEDGRRRTPPLVELAELARATRAVETNSETAAELDFLRGRGTSLGGLRPKCSVLDADGALSIGKFPSVTDERPVTQGEVLALTLARKAGINAADARLVASDGVPVAVIRRFDRTTDGGRLLYASAATLLGAEPGEERSYAEIADALRQYGSQPANDIEELWRRIAFSILISNVDDHLRNHGFLHVDRGQWRLAPAFDVNPFPDRAHELKTWISPETGPEATIDALLSVTKYFRISDARARTILAEVEGAVATWRHEGRQLGMTAADLDTFADAFEHKERQAARNAAQ